jgi:hypothetical protein
MSRYKFAHRTSHHTNVLHSSVTTDTHHLDCFDIEQLESSRIAATAGASTESDAQSSSSFGPTRETKRRATSVLHSEQLHAPQFSSSPT